MIGHSGLDDHFLDVSVMREEADEMHGNRYFRCRPGCARFTILYVFHEMADVHHRD